MISRFFCLAAGLTIAFAAPAFAAETLTATFTQPDGGVTSGLYSGLVNVTVSGTGQSDGTVFNDAFYLLTPDAGADKNYYQLTFGTSPLVALMPSQNAVNYIIGGRPVQSRSNVYSFTLNTGTATPSKLHFGVGDGDFTDNTGSFLINVSAVPEPATWTMMIFGFGAIGFSMRAAKRRSDEKFDAKIKRITFGIA